VPIILESEAGTPTSGLSGAALVSAVIQQGGTDANRTIVLSLLNEVYAQQVADSRWLRTIDSIATTVAGTTEYVLAPDVVESYGLKVGGTPYELVGEDTMWQLTSGRNWGRGGIYSQGYDTAGNTVINVWPAPEQDGDDIVLYAARVPAALEDDTGSYPVTPADSHSSLIDGTLALVFQRIDEREDMAAPRWNNFVATTEKLRRRKHSLLRGSKPAQLLVEGIHFR
jgi:hypothetical protein